MIITTSNHKINLSPVTLEDEIFQNVVHLLNTIEGSVPLNRNFGLSFRAVDKPVIEAEGLYIQEVYEKISKYEPRLIIDSIEIDKTETKNGVLKPIIKGHIVEV